MRMSADFSAQRPAARRPDSVAGHPRLVDPSLGRRVSDLSGQSPARSAIPVRLWCSERCRLAEMAAPPGGGAAAVNQSSTCSAMLRASSTSIPR